MNDRNWKNDQLCCRYRSVLRILVRCRMPSRSSSTMARPVCLAVSTMRRLMTWLMARWWRFSLPDSRFKEPLALPRAFGLGGTPNLGVMRTDSIYLRGFMDRAIAVDGHAATTQIDAECSLGLQGLGGLSGQLDMEEVLPVAALDQGGTGRLLALQKRFLPLAQAGREFHPARQQGQTEGPVPLLEGEDPGIVVDRRGLKLRVHLGRDLQRRAGPRDGPDGEVGGEPEGLAYLSVTGVLDLHLRTLGPDRFKIFSTRNSKSV